MNDLMSLLFCAVTEKSRVSEVAVSLSGGLDNVSVFTHVFSPLRAASGT